MMLKLNRKVLTSLNIDITEFEQKLYKKYHMVIPVYIDLDAQTQFHNRECEIFIIKLDNALCSHFGFTKEVLLDSKRSTDTINMARFIAYKLIKQHFPKTSLKAIGKHYGNRDHSTIINGINNINAWLDTESKTFNRLVVARFNGFLESVKGTDLEFLTLN